MLSIKNLKANVDGKEILKGINLEIKTGEVHAIMGPNGSGKTTLLKTFLGLLEPLSGSIEHVSTGEHLLFGYVPQRESLDSHFPLTALEVALMGRFGRIGTRIAQFYPKPGGYDHNFVLDGEPGQRAAAPPGNGKPLVLAARVREPVSGRVMEVRTTEPGVQLYTGNHLKHAALCLETQHYPDSVNHPGFPSTILRPGQAFSSTTAFAFSVK